MAGTHLVGRWRIRTPLTVAPAAYDLVRPATLALASWARAPQPRHERVERGRNGPQMRGGRKQ